MKESTKEIAKEIVNHRRHDALAPAKPGTPVTNAMLDYINASKSGMPSLIVALNRREGK